MKSLAERRSDFRTQEGTTTGEAKWSKLRLWLKDLEALEVDRIRQADQQPDYHGQLKALTRASARLVAFQEVFEAMEELTGGDPNQYQDAAEE